jgi:LysM repeat protein
MVVKRIAACLLLLTLAGCYRQSEDSFAPSSVGSDTQATPDGAATEQLPVILEPTLDSVTGVPIISPTENGADTPVDGTDPLAGATATIVIFVPPTQVIPTEENLFSTLPTATVPVLITPVMGNPLQVTLNPTTVGPTPITSFLQTTPGASDLAPTPTDLPTEVMGACDYTIVSGDTLYRIAIRNSVELADLLDANGLSESSILQLGQVITIPNCVPEGTTVTGGVTATVAPGIFLPTPTGITVSNGTPGAPNTTGTTEKYVVKSGDTLSKIAAALGIEMQALIDANELVNPNRLSIGQELVVPR